MLFYLKFFDVLWGPFRMLGSHIILLCIGALCAAIVVWWFIPKQFNKLPRDHGKTIVPDGMVSAGKPTGAGKYLMLFTLPILFFVLPFSIPDIDRSSNFADVIKGINDTISNPKSWHLFINPQWGIVLCLVATMVTGYLDDKAVVPWGRLRKGLLDAMIATVASLILCKFQTMEMWVPFFKNPIHVSCWWYVVISVVILWTTMNATNCSDGVDGLAGSLTMMSLLTFTIFLYGVVGHEQIAKYLLIPHNPDGAKWAILTATITGSVAGYLWHNAEPSKVLMGDAGSRPLGLLVGIAALACGNPFLIFVVAPIVILNGGTGLLKIVLLKIMAKAGFDIRHPESEERKRDQSQTHPIIYILHKIRFPLHDHCKRNMKWSNAQVLMRFVLIQAILGPILFLIMIKVR